jgi:hypothetical protein
MILSLRHKAVFLTAVASFALVALVFACGADNGGAPESCTSAVCEGGSDSSTSDTAFDTGLQSDTPSDSTGETDADAGSCSLEAPDADAGPSGTLQWALNFGVSGYTYPASVARDPANGDIVVTGYFWGTTDFGGGPLVSQAANDGSGSDVFVARFDKSGAYKWAKASVNANNNAAANGVAVDGAGNVVIGGVFRGNTLDLGGGGLAGVGSSSLFLVQLDKTGNYQWGKSFGTVGEFAGLNTVAADSTGNVVIAGGGTSLNLGGGALSGFIIAKFNSAGGHVWSKGITATTSYGGPYAALDSEGSAILAGSFSKSIDLGGGPLNTPGAAAGDGTNAAFVAKLDPSGKHVWSHQYGEGTGTKNASVTGVAADPCGNIIVHGPFSGTIDFGAGPFAGVDPTKSYAFMAKVSPTGTGIWSKAFVGSNGANVSAFGLSGVAVGPTGGPTIAPTLPGGVGYQSTTDYGGGALTGNTGNGSATSTIASFDATGTHLWSYAAEASSTARASAAAATTGVAPWGSTVVLAGTFTKCLTVCATSPPGTTLVLAGETLTAVSGQDLFLASFAR